MAATTELFLQLQRIYKEQAEADVTAIEAHLHKILRAHGRAAASIPRAFIKQFCKNARNLRCERLTHSCTPISCHTNSMKRWYHLMYESHVVGVWLPAGWRDTGCWRRRCTAPAAARSCSGLHSAARALPQMLPSTCCCEQLTALQTHTSAHQAQTLQTVKQTCRR